MAEALLTIQHQDKANLDCIHCGLCLSVCPTYLQLGSEVDSPRGRIYLIKAMNAGRISASSPTFEKHMHLCLECRACESACPSGVTFSLMMNDARAAIREARPHGSLETFLRKLIFEKLLPSRRLLRANFGILRIYQRAGIQKLIRATGLLKLLSRRLAEMESLLPSIPPAARYDLPKTVPATDLRKVSLFEGCIMPEMFGPVNEATVRVLERNRAAVCRPPRQTCCGALHLHDGERELARQLARRNIEAFESDGADVIIVNAAGCGAMLKEYGHLLHDDPGFAARAGDFSRRIRDISEYLEGIGLNREMGSLDLTVAYDDPCHLLHGQGIKAAPREILHAIPGLRLVELRDADRCCGSAGIYNITHPEMSARVLEEKISNIERSGAQMVVTGNPGCLLQISQGLRSRKLPIKTAHPVELLDQAYRRYGDASTAPFPADGKSE